MWCVCVGQLPVHRPNFVGVLCFNPGMEYFAAAVLSYLCHPTVGWFQHREKDRSPQITFFPACSFSVEHYLFPL